MMDQSANEAECGICLDALKNPVALPCSHKFCSKCLDGWRSKYGVMGTKFGDDQNRKCPLCRGKIPPSKEMISQLKNMRNYQRLLEEKGDTFSQDYMMVNSQRENLEREFGDWTETIDYSEHDDQCLALPDHILEAARANDIQKILNWLGPLPVDKERLNARNPEVMDYTLVYFAVLYRNSDLLSILLQLGADVDAVSANGGTPLSMVATMPNDNFYAQARLLFEWGADDLSNSIIGSKDDFAELAHKYGSTKLANLLKSEFGGRRCEIINLSKRPDLNGTTCLVEKYLTDKGRYKVIFETSKEAALLAPQNLERLDRTPDDCGYYITYKNGRATRREFASKEECQAFVASLTEGDKSGDGDNNAEALARAEEAAASLLAAVGDEKEATSTAEAATNETCEKKAAAGDQARAEESAATTDEVRAEEAAAALLAELDLEGTKSSARNQQKGKKKKKKKKGKKNRKK